MNKPPFVSVVVPTYNRAEFLKNSIPSFIRQNIDKSFFEILIIDNNSTDETKAVSENILRNSGASWRYIFEGSQGLHYARNRGILEAKGDIIVFGDDDIEANEEWLFIILNEFKTNPNVGIVGGRIFPKWNSPPPEWIYDYGDKNIHGVFAYYDLGNKKKNILKGDPLPMGCNFAINKRIAIQIGGSPPDTFPKELKHQSGLGESMMVMKTLTLGYDVVYLPDAVVYHYADVSRATLEYFVDRYERWAVEEVFGVFKKNNSKFRSVVKVLEISCPKFLNAKNAGKDKIDPKKFEIVAKKMGIMGIKQVFRVVSDSVLYKEIIKDNYLIW